MSVGDPREILILRALGLGDLLTAVPALRGVRQAFPDANITLATRPELAPVVELMGAVNQLLPSSGLDAPLRTRTPPELSINFHGCGPESHRALISTRAATVWSFRHPRVPHLRGPRWHDDEHETQRWCRLLRWYAVTADPTNLRLARPSGPSVAPGVVVIHPGASARARQWPAASFATVAEALHDDGHRIVVTGNASERPLAHEVAARAGFTDHLVLAGALDMNQLAALVADAALVVSGDTGIAHLATAYATPSVTVFGPASPERWGPPAEGPHTVVWSGTVGDSLLDEPDQALAAVPTARVLAAARHRLALPRDLRPPAPPSTNPVRAGRTSRTP